jgi:hypothetical protein
MVKTFKGFTPAEPVTFDMESPDGSRKITVRCKPVAGSLFLDFMSRAESMENFAAMAIAVKDILNAAIADEDIEAFWAFADDPANGVTLDVLSEISGFLAESFAGDRPTVPRPV